MIYAKQLQKDLGKILLKLEALQDDQIENGKKEVDKSIELSEQEKAEALTLLKDKNLVTIQRNSGNPTNKIWQFTFKD